MLPYFVVTTDNPEGQFMPAIWAECDLKAINEAKETYGDRIDLIFVESGHGCRIVYRRT